MKEDTTSQKDPKACKYKSCTVKPRSGEYCGQHKRRFKVKTTQEQLNEFSDKVGLGVNKRVSNFAISITTNKNADDQETTNKFIQVLSYLYKDDGIRDFVVDKYGKELDFKSYESLYGKVEVGDQQHRTNHHGLIKIEHNNTLKVDLPRLREFLTGVFGHAVHVDVKNLGSDSDKFQNYAQKHNLV